MTLMRKLISTFRRNIIEDLSKLIN